MAAQLHQCVISAGAISAASAVLCGLELIAVKKELKKTQVLAFLDWFEGNQDNLGFSIRTKDNYMRAAEETKAKLLKQGDKSILTILDCAPSSMTEYARKKLLESVRKCISGKSLIDIYIEAGIVKAEHKAPRRSEDGKLALDVSTEEAPAKTRSDETIIQEQLLLPLENFEKGLNSTVRLGEARIELWAKLSDKKFREIESRLQLASENLNELIRKLSEARKK
jgi:hypothetical protein